MKSRPEVGAAREDEAMEVVGGAHGLDDDVREGAGDKSLQLDVIAERGKVAIQRTELSAGQVIGVLRGRDRHFHLGTVSPGGLRVLGLHRE